MITPEIAERILSGKAPNRHVSASVIHKYARDMAAGRWCLNGQTIKISSSGKLLDGQHRLEAAKKAKRSFQSIIVEGLPEDSFGSLDIGRRRSVADILRERGESHTMSLASSLRWLWMIKNEVILAANTSPTNGELLKLLEENPGIRRSLRHVSTIREIMGSGIAAALHYTFAIRDLDKANEFFSRLMDGVQLSDTSPIYHLRERLIRTRSSHRVRLAEAERVALAIKAWNAFRQGRPMQLLVWRNRGAMREALPTPA
uniref:ParB/Sulfiredoxin domain-containing protein n=1 Tax=Caulobacter sp. (strain K31) TaxID=366602 RepID=B0SYI2_CAUSK